MTIAAFANTACRDLPPGWELYLYMEHGAGYFELYDPNGDRIDSEDYCSVDDSMDRQGELAVEYAKKHAANIQPEGQW